MLRLLAPAGLLALLALALPVVLHLRQPPPPTVRVGSLAFLQALPRRRPWRRPRWREWTLLALRTVLLTLLALALARPEWRRPEPKEPRRWVLLDPAGGATENGAPRERLAALTAAGYETRWFTPGFPKTRGDDGGPAPPADLWSLLRELDARLPVGSALAVFSPARLATLRSTRPTLARCTVEWVETPLATAAAGDAARRKGEALDQPGPKRTETPLRIVVLHAPDRVADAHRLTAAVRAAARVGGHVEPTLAVNPEPAPTTARTPTTAPDWVFCLGISATQTTRLLEAAGAAGTRNLFTDAGEAPLAGDDVPPAVLVAAPEVTTAGDPDATVALRRRVTTTAPVAKENGGDSGGPSPAVLWTDGTGRPGLTVRTTGTTPAPGRLQPEGGAPRRHWQFFSRFDPDWSDLAETTALPEALRAWLFPGDARGLDPATDPRLAGAGQARPREGRPRTAATATDVPGPTLTTLAAAGPPAVDLRGGLLTLAAVLFLLERFWGHHRFNRAAVATTPTVTAS